MYASTAANAYATTTRSTGSPRSTEYQAFQRVTARLQKAAAADLSDAGAYHEMIEAVHMNNRLWSTLLFDLADERNTLPMELRAQLINIGGYVRRHGEGLLEKGAAAELDPLIAINTAVMKGLRGDAGGEPSVSEPHAAIG